MKIIGLTGGIGSGKSTVAQFLAELGAVVLDVDKVGHEALEPGNYYVRVKAMDGASNESGWSAPIVFTAGTFPGWLSLWLLIVLVVIVIAVIGGIIFMALAPRV